MQAIGVGWWCGAMLLGGCGSPQFAASVRNDTEMPVYAGLFAGDPESAPAERLAGARIPAGGEIYLGPVFGPDDPALEVLLLVDRQPKAMAPRRWVLEPGRWRLRVLEDSPAIAAGGEVAPAGLRVEVILEDDGPGGALAAVEPLPATVPGGEGPMLAEEGSGGPEPLSAGSAAGPEGSAGALEDGEGSSGVPGAGDARAQAEGSRWPGVPYERWRGVPFERP